jgi:Protein of unknown function (DUF3293)
MRQPSCSTEGFLFPVSAIDPSTVQAYLETEYHVHAQPPFTLRAGQFSAELLRLQERKGTDSSAYVTACNPFSQLLDEAANAVRQASLARELTSRNLDSLSGVGKHPDSSWPGEDSFLIMGLSLEAAKDLGVRLEQNAILWAGADAVPQLILLR